MVGVVSNADAASGTTVGLAPGFTFDIVRLVDLSSPINGASTGGFDVDAVRVSPVPLPASGLLLLGAFGGFAALRRKKSA